MAFKLKLKGKTAVFVDWANVYGWKKSLKGTVNLQLLWLTKKGIFKAALVKLGNFIKNAKK
jgi:hypothetical protein